MTKQELLQQALALEPHERVEMADALFDCVDDFAGADAGHDEF